MTDSTTHTPSGDWRFDEAVTSVFDDMLARSIPQYEVMRSLCSTLARRYVRPGSCVLDLGSSRGRALTDLAREVDADDVRFVGLEVSRPMLDAARGSNNDPRVTFLEADLRRDPLAWRTSVVMSVLTLQFVPIVYRQAILDRVRRSLQPGGAFICVEKVLGSSGDVNTLLVDEYHKLKQANGYAPDAVEAKRQSLERVLVPLTASMNEAFFKDAGFRAVDVFWRHLNFCAWLCLP